jgi:hypothetical protein
VLLTPHGDSLRISPFRKIDGSRGFRGLHFFALWHENSALLWQWQAYEYPLRQQAQQRHEGPPEPGQVYDYRIAFTRAMGWSQEDLAAIAGVSVPTVKRLKAADGLLGGCEDTGMKLRGLFAGAV